MPTYLAKFDGKKANIIGLEEAMAECQVEGELGFHVASICRQKRRGRRA